MTTLKGHPWHDKNWTISSAAPAPAKAVMMNSSGPSQFRLVPVKQNGTVVSFAVAFDPGAMTGSWKNCVMIPRGATKPSRPPGLPLPPFGPASTAQYDTVVQLVLNEVRSPQAHFNAERLEGDLAVNGRHEGVTFYRLEDAIQRPDGRLEDLLIIDLQSDHPSPVVPREDGTAHGHPL